MYEMKLRLAKNKTKIQAQHEILLINSWKRNMQQLIISDVPIKIIQLPNPSNQPSSKGLYYRYAPANTVIQEEPNAADNNRFYDNRDDHTERNKPLDLIKPNNVISFLRGSSIPSAAIHHSPLMSHYPSSRIIAPEHYDDILHVNKLSDFESNQQHQQDFKSYQHFQLPKTDLLNNRYNNNDNYIITNNSNNNNNNIAKTESDYQQKPSSDKIINPDTLLNRTNYYTSLSNTPSIPNYLPIPLPHQLINESQISTHQHSNKSGLNFNNGLTYSSIENVNQPQAYYQNQKNQFSFINELPQPTPTAETTTAIISSLPSSSLSSSLPIVSSATTTPSTANTSTAPVELREQTPMTGKADMDRDKFSLMTEPISIDRQEKGNLSTNEEFLSELKRKNDEFNSRLYEYSKMKKDTSKSSPPDPMQRIEAYVSGRTPINHASSPYNDLKFLENTRTPSQQQLQPQAYVQPESQPHIQLQPQLQAPGFADSTQATPREMIRPSTGQSEHIRGTGDAPTKPIHSEFNDNEFTPPKAALRRRYSIGSGLNEKLEDDFAKSRKSFNEKRRSSVSANLFNGSFGSLQNSISLPPNLNTFEYRFPDTTTDTTSKKQLLQPIEYNYEPTQPNYQVNYNFDKQSDIENTKDVESEKTNSEYAEQTIFNQPENYRLQNEDIPSNTNDIYYENSTEQQIDGIDQSNQSFDYNTQQNYEANNSMNVETFDDDAYIEQKMNDMYIDDNNQQKNAFKGNDDFESNYEHPSISPTSNSGHR